MFQFEDITGLENAFKLVLKHSPASGSTNSKYRLVNSNVAYTVLMVWGDENRVVSQIKTLLYVLHNQLRN